MRLPKHLVVGWALKESKRPVATHGRLISVEYRQAQAGEHRKIGSGRFLNGRYLSKKISRDCKGLADTDVSSRIMWTRGGLAHAKRVTSG